MNELGKLTIVLRIFLITLLLLAWGCGGGSNGGTPQTTIGSINGQVYEGALIDNRYLSDVPVTLFDNSGTTAIKNTFTNSTGLYHFTGIANGEYKVRFTLNNSNFAWYQQKSDAVSATSVVVPSTTTSAVNMVVPYTKAENLGGGNILLSNNAATIYYTTNGNNPDTSSVSAQNSVQIQITQSTTIKFFSIIDGISEAIKTMIFSP